MTRSATAEIFIIGNEILTGEIQDTNTHWLCRELNNLGGRVVRSTVLRDDLPVIAAEIRGAIKRGTRVVFTAGGLGPTADDLTLAAVAEGAGLPLRMHQEAREMIRARYDDFHARGVLEVGGLTPAREKMALLPESAEALPNPVGTAPGVLLKVGGTTIVSLPGVPPELQGIFHSSLQPFLQKNFCGGVSVLRTLIAQCSDESLLEPVLSKVAPAHPEVYIKSLATRPGDTPELDILLTAAGPDPEGLERLVEAALKDLQAGLRGLGIAYRDKPPAP